MATTVAQLKTRVTGRYDDAVDSTKFGDAYFIARVNDFEQYIHREVIKKYYQATASTVASQQTYSFPSGVTFDDLASTIYIDGIGYQKVSGQIDYSNPQLDYSFWHDTTNNKIAFYPIPTASGTNNITINYRYAPALKTATSDTLTLPDKFLLAYEFYIMMQIYRIDLNVPERRDHFTDLYNMEEREIRNWWGDSAPIQLPDTIIDYYSVSETG